MAARDEQPGGGGPKRNWLMRYAARFDDGEVMRWAFRGLLVGSIGVLALDLRELVRENGGLWPQEAAAPASFEPVLPPAVDGDESAPSVDPRPFLTTDGDALRRPVSFALKPGGVLEAVGTIDLGAAARFASEVEARGEYVETVSLNSPGGSLEDAMAMSNLIREKGFATEVGDGALCASSCPLVFAGGEERRAGAKAAIGVHQFYAGQSDAGEPSPARIMSDAQATTARISRHLSDMGLEPALWLHALETPPRSLYYFSPEELVEYRIVTDRPPAVAVKP
jgi:hypothetical protein